MQTSQHWSSTWIPETKTKTKECETCGGGGKAIWESQLMTCGACGGTGEVEE